MSSITRIDQAVLLLKERLRRLGPRTAQRGEGAAAAGPSRSDPLLSLRQLAQQRQIGPDELRKAFVRTLLADALGEELAGSLEFQSVSDQVLRILQDSESGRDLLDQALAELR